MKADVARFQCTGIVPCDSESLMAQIGRDHPALRTFASDCYRDGASPGAQIGNCLRHLSRDAAEGLLDQQFCFGARYQGVGSNLEIKGPKIALAVDLRQWPMCCAISEQGGVVCGRFGRHALGERPVEILTALIECMGQQEFGVEPRLIADGGQQSGTCTE